MGHESDVDFLRVYGPWAVIAGGSEGLGVAFAHRLAKRGLNLVLIARKPAPLEALAAEVRSQYGHEVRTIALDLTAPDAVPKIISATQGCDVGLLICNAGADHKFGPFIDRPLAESERMITLNVLTPTRLIRHFAPEMVKRKKGGIIALSSLASMAGFPGNLVYAATKAFSNVFAEGLWHELGKHGVHVLGLIIGAARTPAMRRLGLTFDESFADPNDLVDEALEHIDKGPTIHAGGLEEHALRLRSLPRAQAVRELMLVPDKDR